MTRMTGPDCVVMCNLINTHKHKHTHTHTHGVGGGNGEDVNGHYRDGDGAGTGTGTGVEVNEGARDGNGDGDEDGNGDGSEGSSGDGNGDDDKTERGGREAKKRKKPQNSCRVHVGNGGDLGGKKKECRKERVGPVAANPDNLESKKEAGGQHKALRAQVRTVHVEGGCPLCCA